METKNSTAKQVEMRSKPSKLLLQLVVVVVNK